MQKKKKEKKEKILSPSRIKTYQSCSWIYHCNYVLKVPDKSNDGAKRGTCTHLILECLLNKRHRHHYDKIIKEGTFKNIPSIVRMVKKQAKKDDLNLGGENFDMIDEMTLVALKADFFCSGGELFSSELEFIIENEDPYYKIKGIIDKMARYPNEILKIFDYKTSKSKFEGDEIGGNVQSMTYQLYGKKKEGAKKVYSDFLFLRFPDDPVVEINFSDEQLAGFESYLEFLFKKINNFTEKDAKANLAANKPFAKKGEGFKGRTMCGKAGYPGQLKKDGTPMWHCTLKFPFDYYVLKDKDGRVISTAFEKKDLTEKENCTIVKVRYEGCPAYNKSGQSDIEDMFC